MKKSEAAIKSGIGYYDAPRDAAMTADVSESFLSGHCVNQELYQDIRNAIREHYQREAKLWQYINGRRHTPILFTKVDVFDAHKVACILVGLLTPNFHGAWINTRAAGRLYVSITDDGLITDIVQRPENMNPGNGRSVYAHKW